MRKRIVVTSLVLALAVAFAVAAPGRDAAAAQVSAVEFYHAGLGHFFFATLPAETNLLDTGTIAGWSRTWTEFKVDDEAGPDLVPVCRFFSSAFAPASSHFYSAFADECAAVAADWRWTYEGTAFYARLPDAGGACPAGTLAVHRGYNQAQGGVPAHRLSPWPQDACGYFRPQCSFEGRGPGGVAFCIPVSPELALSRTEQLAGTAWDFTEVITGLARTVRVQFGPVEAGQPWQAPPRYMLDIPYGVSLSLGPGVAGWDPLAGKVNMVFFQTVYQFDYDGGDAISGCAYHPEDLFDDVRGPCRPLTGRRL